MHLKLCYKCILETCENNIKLSCRILGLKIREHMGAKGKYETQFPQRVKELLGFVSDYTVLAGCSVQICLDLTIVINIWDNINTQHTKLSKTGLNI